MTNTKRILSLLAAVALLCGILPHLLLSARAEELTGTCGETLDWHFDSETGVLTIKGSGAMQNYSGNAPWHGFRKSVRTVVFPAELSYIGQYAFYDCKNLTELSLPAGLTSIGGYAFQNCTGLAEFTLPANLSVIGQNAFHGCAKLKEAIFPAGLTSIGDSAFRGCSGLKTVKFLSELTSIGNYAFRGCSGLTEFVFPAGNTSIRDGVCYGCSGLTKVTFPEGLTSIGSYVFNACSGLTELAFPESLSSINQSAFEGCTGLKEAYLPAGLKSISRSVFEGCTGLKEVGLPEGLKSIDQSAFKGCTGLKEMRFPAGLNSIGKSAFEGCIGLTEVQIPAGLSSIGERAFYGCEKLTNVVVPNSVTTIAPWAIGHCLTGEAISDFIIYGYAGSAAEAYAAEHSFIFVPLDPASGFCDVEPGRFYYDPMLWALETGITKGTSQVRFSPVNSCTRAQVVTFLWRAMGEPEPTVTAHPFADVAEGSFYYQAMLWAVEQGITKGTSASEFSPNAPCSRGQVVTFLHRAMKTPEPTVSEHAFTDVEESAFYYEAMLWAVEQGITQGTDAAYFSPDKPCTRGHVVTFLYRLLGE